MAPFTRRSGTGGAVAKKVHRKRPTRREPSDSWELLERQGLNANEEDDDMMYDDQDHVQQLPSPEVPADGVDEAVNGLREMAERVGKEVETFAQKLDQFFEELPTRTSRYDAARELVEDFRNIAEETVRELKTNHEREMRQQLRHEWSEQTHLPSTSNALRSFSSAPLGARKAEQVKQLRRWQQEADIWELFRLMLELHPFNSERRDQQAENEQRLAQMGPPHRYTSESDLWERFLLEKNLARERYLVKKWLERTADHQDSDVQGIVDELETKASRGKGLWSAGWLHTRERIKGEKRLRVWPSPIDSPLPQIRRSDNNELLVTTLDPDAPARQQRTLEKDDSYFERAIWIACWEMLRHGTPWEEVCEWCEERTEGWRAVCTGRAMDLTEPATSNAAWRHMCHLASQSGCSNEYEAAVFGLLGGSVKAVEKICRTVDDHLYAYYSATVMQQYDQYVLAVCPEQAMPQSWRRGHTDDAVHDPERAEQAITALVKRLKKGPATKDEQAQPMKIIQGYLLADQVGSLIHTIGIAIGATASLHGPEDLVRVPNTISEGSKPLAETEVALNPQTLRIVAHMSIVHRILDPDYLEGDELLEDENVLVAYILALRAAGKRDLIPVYASKLQRDRSIVTLGRILQDVTEESEQRHMLALLSGYELDVVAILIDQLNSVVETSLSGEELKKPLRILEKVDQWKLHPGQQIIVDFLPGEITDDDDKVVRALSWFQLLNGHWHRVFQALTVALRRCLAIGRFTCARMIVQNFPFEEVAQRKSYETFHHSLNPLDPASSTPLDETDAQRWDSMKRQANTYYELEQVVHAIEALSNWRGEEHKYISKSPRPASVPSALKHAKAALAVAMHPLLKEGGILLSSADEDEAAELEHIRTAYLPELVIAYNTVLHAAGNLITRDSLLESMDLAVLVAREEEVVGNGIRAAVLRAGRMRELVGSFALTGKVMLVLKAEGKVWKAKKGEREGKDLGVWEVGGAGADGDGDGDGRGGV